MPLLLHGRFNGAEIRILGYDADRYAELDSRWRFAARQLIEIAPSTGFAAGPA